MEIPDNKLYREVRLTNGIHSGVYRIYWNKYICEKMEKRAVIYKWGDIEVLKAEAGNWVETYDGTVIQILDIRIYKDKKNRIFHFFKFPVATVYAWTNYLGITKFRQFQGNFMTAGRNTMKMTIAGSDNQKVRFASYIVSGMNPLKAYRLAFNNLAPTTVTTLHRRVNQMITDDIVRKEIVSQIEPLIDKINKSFSDERLINELDDLLTRSRKGTDAHRENIKFIMALMNKLPEHMYPNKKKDKAIDINYEEVKPPGLE